MNNHSDDVMPMFKGHVLIRDVETGQILLDKSNDIHFENMSIAIAQSLAGKDDTRIARMAFGSGGAAISGTGGITYYPPNVVGINADLYNETYSKDIESNDIEVRHLITTVYSDIIITCRLDYGEPAGQEAFDDSQDINSDYTFDELGLKTTSGRLLTHVIFSPVQKSLNRLIEVVYTIRITLN